MSLAPKFIKKKRRTVMKRKQILAFVFALSMLFTFFVLPANAESPYAIVLPDLSYDGSQFIGTFYIRNYEYDKHIQIDDDASVSASGAAVELWDMNYGTNQQWQISYAEDDDYFKIISVASGLALTVPAGYNGSIMQESYV